MLVKLSKLIDEVFMRLVILFFKVISKFQQMLIFFNYIRLKQVLTYFR